MHSKDILTVGLAALPLATAHFQLNYPPARGFDEDKLPTFPCGGQDKVSTSRTSVSMTSFPVALDMGHDESAVQILLGLGSDPGSNFNITLVPTFREQGLGNFCMRTVSIPTDMGVTDGMEATLQVVTNGDPNGGLYNCADIRLTNSAPPMNTDCKNNTGVSAVTFPMDASMRDANQSTPDGQAQSGASSSTSGMSSMSGMPSSTASGSSSSPTGGAGLVVVSEGLLAAAFFGAAAMI